MGASAGRVLLIPKGDWNASTTYTGLDWVRHNGAAWVCKNTCTNIEPTEANSANWQMMARDGDGITADTAMSDTSTNAVQNKVIKSYVDNSIAGISDMTGATATQNGAHGLVPAPQAGDEKKVLLGDGTWEAIDGKFSFSDHDTATSGTSFTDAEDGNMLVTDWTKNLLNPMLETTTLNGITCTNNGDGTYTLNGTATSDIHFDFATNISIKKGIKYKVIGTPKQYTSPYANVYYRNTDWSFSGADWSDGVMFNGDDLDDITIAANIPNGTALDNVLIKPMLTTDLSATYDDFVPYSGYEIKTCGKNLLNPNDYIDGRNIKNDFDTIYSANTNSDNRIWSYEESNYYFKAKTQNMTLIIDVVESFNEGGFGVFSEDGIVIYEKFSGGFPNTGIHKYVLNVEPEKMYGIMLKLYSGKVKISLYNSDETDYEPYTGETITVTNDTESPAFGLKSHKGITHIISPGNVKCVYPTNESGKGVLDAMYNNELSKLKNAIFKYSTKEEYDAAVANNDIPDGATVIKDYDD